jgi:hypothetical protein
VSDLINRKVVMDWLRDLQAQAIINSNNGTLVDATIESAVNSFINFIVQVPTSYDVDKTVKRLEQLIENYNFNNSGYSIGEKCDAVYEAIEIVKGAVKDE